MSSDVKARLRARVTEFGYPPIHDALVIGKDAPLGSEAFRKAVSLLVAAPFDNVDVEDETIGSMLVRTAILRRVSRDVFVDFVLRRVKPLMTSDEILHLDMQIELELEDDKR